MNAPDASRPFLDLARIRAAAPAWVTVEVVDAAPSTNALVAARATSGAPEGLVVVAEHQTAGRGRLDRTWVTPPRAALTFSVLLRPRVPDPRWPWLPLLAGVALVDGVEGAGGPRCALKWPNDLLYDGRKLAGLLVERVETPTGPAAVLGIGLNVSTSAEELPVPGAGSLATVGRPGLDRGLLLVRVLEALGHRLRDWTREEGDPRGGLLEDYRTRCVTVGQQVTVHLPSGVSLVGRATGVTEDGGLEVDGAGGVVRVSAGDVVHVRPA